MRATRETNVQRAQRERRERDASLKARAAQAAPPVVETETPLEAEQAAGTQIIAPDPPFVAHAATPAVSPPPVVPKELSDDRAEGERLLALANQVQVVQDTQPQQVAQPPKPGKSAEMARDEAMKRIAGERQAEVSRRAQVAEAARRSGKPIPAVSASWSDQTPDPSMMLGSDGRNLVRDDEIGYICSMDDPNNKSAKTDRFYLQALSQGARPIVRDDGQPWRSDFGIGVAFPIEVSARRLANANAQRLSEGDLNPESNFNAMASQQGLMVRDVSPDETGFLTQDMEDAERGVTGILPSRPGHFSGSFASAADALDEMRENVIRI